MAKHDRREAPDKDAAATAAKNGSSSENGGRRGFLEKVTAIVVGVVISLTPVVVGLVTLLDPLRSRKRGAAAEGASNSGAPPPDAGPGRWIKVAKLAEVPIDGTPFAFPVIADTWDAWNYYPPHPVGSVFLRLPKQGEKPIAWTTICPHLGCFVEFVSSQKCFSCPCHNSKFNLEGERIEGPPPRAMDTLEVEVRQGDEVWVRYEKFRTGESHKVAV
jgi:menaquinol-cytochrome c reductase iron-sulfur subunit